MKLISIVICTYDRACRLKNALESLLELKEAEMIDHEIIIVDNNSPDDTGKAVEYFIPLFSGRLRYVFEKRQGLSCARNRGIEEAVGEFIAFLDDDVSVDKDWLRELALCIESNRPDCIGGRVLPRWESKKPWWLTKEIYMNLGLLNYGNEPYQITSESNPIVGANFAVKKVVIKNEKYCFKTRLGRQGKKLFSSEETELFIKLMRDGYKIWYCPSSYVYHNIPKERTRMSYFLKWNYYYGQSYGYMQDELSKIYSTAAAKGDEPKQSVKRVSNPFLILLFFSIHMGIAKYMLKKRFSLKDYPD